MAKNININRSVNDVFYRYKMPRIQAKVEGKGNGIKTVLFNMTEIAKSLARPATYPTKYFGCELGAQTNFDVKNDRYIVNGEHDANNLQDILDGFIKKFVLCPACDNPETTLTVKRQTVNGKCKACGHAFIIDPKQKLTTFILKNPPPVEGAENDGKDKQTDGGSPAADGSFSCETSPAVIKNQKEIENFDEDWAPEPSEDVLKLSGQVGKLVIDKDLDKTEDERLDMLHQYFIKAKEDGTILDGKTIANEAERLELKTKAPLLLADVLFDADMINQIKLHRGLLLRFCMDDKKAQRHLLGGIEMKIFANKKALLPKTAHIVKALYDLDLCDEETILSWGSKPKSKYVTKEFMKELIKSANPVIKWLQEAEEEDSDTDESIQYQEAKKSIYEKKPSDSEDDINIDDI